VGISLPDNNDNPLKAALHEKISFYFLMRHQDLGPIKKAAFADAAFLFRYAL